MTVYGVKWHSDATSPTLDRLESNVGLTAGASFNTLSPWTMRRCNVWDDGTPTAYYGDRCYTDTDVANMGQCMVQIPKFWYAVDASLANHVAYYISDTATPSPAIAKLDASGNLTFAVNPAFIVDGAAVAHAYIGAYEAYNNVSNILESRAGVAPVNTSLLSMTNARTFTQARSVDRRWNLETIQARGALILLFIIEYASLNCQDTLGQGNANGTAALTTGTTTTSGNTSYGVKTDALHAVSYRGIENPWADLGEVVEGVNIKTGQTPWMAPQATTVAYYAFNKFSGGYSNTGLTTQTNGYPAVMDTAVVPWAFVALTNGGSNATYFCDGFAIAAGGDLVPVVGGYYGWASLDNGIFSWWGKLSTDNAVVWGFRIQYLPSA